ncbi:hypothetical protein EDB85DRAFT_1899208 [Lactarius pseudohatsudake]|nr:hypothetical protein EDB85DRAFT_1899208 [Lactarius pseudohatsudake]
MITSDFLESFPRDALALQGAMAWLVQTYRTSPACAKLIKVVKFYISPSHSRPQKITDRLKNWEVVRNTYRALNEIQLTEKWCMRVTCDLRERACALPRSPPPCERCGPPRPLIALTALSPPLLLPPDPSSLLASACTSYTPSHRLETSTSATVEHKEWRCNDRACFGTSTKLKRLAHPIFTNLKCGVTKARVGSYLQSICGFNNEMDPGNLAMEKTVTLFANDGGAKSCVAREPVIKRGKKMRWRPKQESEGLQCDNRGLACSGTVPRNCEKLRFAFLLLAAFVARWGTVVVPVEAAFLTKREMNGRRFARGWLALPLSGG